MSREYVRGRLDKILSDQGLANIRKLQNLTNAERVAAGFKPKGPQSARSRLTKIIDNPDVDEFEKPTLDNRPPMTDEHRRILGSAMPKRPTLTIVDGAVRVNRPMLPVHEVSRMNDVQRIALGIAPRGVKSMERIYTAENREEDKPTFEHGERAIVRRVEDIETLTVRDIRELYEHNHSNQTAECRLRHQLSDIFWRYKHLWLDKRGD